MSVFIGYLPWILFGLIAHHNYQLAAEVALITSILIIFPEFLRHKVKILSTGSIIFFIGIFIIASIKELMPLEVWTSVMVTTMLFLIALISILIKKPFTIQYAKESVDEKYWETESFIKTNYIISIVWTTGFGLMAISALIGLYTPDLKETAFKWAPLVITIILLTFTQWYPEYVKKKNSAK